MDSILRFALLLLQFLSSVSNLKINYKSNNINQDINKLQLTQDNYLLEPSLEERINLCKTKLPDFDYDLLDEDERDSLHYLGNACRVDCVVHRNRTFITRTLYFTDGKTVCGYRRVCVADPSNRYGVCQLIPTLPPITTNITTTTTTTNSSTPTYIDTTTPVDTSTSIETSTPTPTTNSPTTNTTTPMISTSTTMEPIMTEITTVSEVCPSANYFRDPTDPECQRFYRCIGYGHNYQRVNYTCQNGTQFDEPIQSCQFHEELRQPCPSSRSERHK